MPAFLFAPKNVQFEFGPKIDQSRSKKDAKAGEKLTMTKKKTAAPVLNPPVLGMLLGDFSSNQTFRPVGARSLPGKQKCNYVPYGTACPGLHV